MNDVEASISLFLQADNYKEMFKDDISSIVDYILPAIKLNQYRVFRRGDNPYAYTSWAYMDSDTSDKFKRTGITWPLQFEEFPSSCGTHGLKTWVPRHA